MIFVHRSASAPPFRRGGLNNQRPIFTNCPAAFQVARRLLPKVHGPVTKAFHGWAQRQFKASSEDATRRRLATPAECANGECYVAQVGMADPTALPTPMSAPFVIGAVTLFGITLDDAEASKAVLQNAVADVAGVEPDAVTITGVASARRRLQGGVVLDYVIQTAGNAEATDVSTALDAAADDPSLVDTAIAAAAAAAGAEEVFAGVTTEDITNDIAVSAPPTPLPTKLPTPAPTVPPTMITYAPTQAPTTKPSSAPTADCLLVLRVCNRHQNSAPTRPHRIPRTRHAHQQINNVLGPMRADYVDM